MVDLLVEVVIVVYVLVLVLLVDLRKLKEVLRFFYKVVVVEEVQEDLQLWVQLKVIQEEVLALVPVLKEMVVELVE